MNITTDDFVEGGLNSTFSPYEGSGLRPSPQSSALWLLHGGSLILFILALCCWTNKKGDSVFCPKVRTEEEEENATNEEDELEAQKVLEARTKQEDEIREQYLLALLKPQTMRVSSSVIHARRDSATGVSNVMTLSESNRGSILGRAFRKSASVDTAPTEIADLANRDDSGGSDDIEAPNQGYDTSDDEDFEDLAESTFQAANEVIEVPLAGLVGEQGTLVSRQVPNGCTICLCSFVPDDRLTWSTNAKCAHVFHHDCLLNWYQAVGRRVQKKRLRRRRNATENLPLKHVCRFTKSCPCCRQTYIDEMKDELNESEAPLVPDDVTEIPSETVVNEDVDLEANAHNGLDH
eukprot:Nitzschia sp. Nitz4//scaffold6_size259037//194605//195728//NITZ4_001103-RA/size259037-augustus-gene-0.301-mRNA-1//1//CDS//3329556980//6639//frame0